MFTHVTIKQLTHSNNRTLFKLMVCFFKFYITCRLSRDKYRSEQIYALLTTLISFTCILFPHNLS